MGEPFKSKTGEQSKGNRALQFKVRKFSHRAKFPPAHECHFAHLKVIFAPCESRCENFAHLNSRCENFRTVRNSLLAHECHFAHLKPLFAPCETRCEIFAQCEIECEMQFKPAHQLEPLELTNSHLAPFRPWQRLGRSFRIPILADASTRAIRHWRRHFATCSDSTVPPSEVERLLSAGIPPGGHPLTCATRRQSQEACSRPPAKRPSSRVLETIPDTSGRAPTEDSQIPVGIPLETVIRRPMIRTAYRGQPGLQRSIFHSETCLMSRLSDSSQTSGIRFVCCRVYDYSASNPTLIHFTIDGRQGAIGARHIAEALRIPYEPVTQADFREWSSFSQRDMVRILSRGTSTASVLTRRELPSGMLLIDVLLRANIPLQHKSTWAILESPALRRRPPLPEDFSLDKWHQLVAYFAPQGALAVPPPQGVPAASTSGAPDMPPPPELPQDEQLPQVQQDEILTDTTPPAPAAHTSVHMPEATLPAAPITHGAPPVRPATSAPPPSLSPLSPFLLRNSEA
ncbi:hypothetical protein CK203_095918 [Vitis vinifera]|uniref:Uncharacterized protein n=1 Tax=Vitis vinifera TaxID=29760 RepID=A0A438DDJ8_VITVI|nr:hypothetical protein CK203_095918 [Vitis vinifera]